ncbi:MAG: YabP/YqfC family sporulation protein [Clostridia bacterium]|nr:YabP/YqfC family sporulation protein [Clostridia bacterium]
MRKNIRRDLSRLHEKLDETLDGAELSVDAQIELSGNREAVVDGCVGVLQYEDTAIRLSTGRRIVRFTGSDLMIRTMQQNQVLITGTILSVEFVS